MTEAVINNQNDGIVVINMMEEVVLEKPTPSTNVPDKKRTNGEIYSNPNDGQVARTSYYQDQTVGSQPVYHQQNRQRNVAANNEDDNNSGFAFLESFNEKEIRIKFIRKVYTILTVQLVFTCIFICFCVFNDDVKNYVRQDVAGVIAAAMVEMMIFFLLVCYEDLRRTFPINFILLGMLTIAFAYITGALSTAYSTHVIMLSIGVTGGICFAISISAWQTSFDITKCLPSLCFVVCVAFINIIILMIIQLFLRLRAIDIIISAIMGLVFCVYLMFDTKMIMGGRRLELSPEEYILGALTLYIDIIHILWAIMRILGECK